jgi:cholest-4-en-3-one 26-monooxygenase
MTITDEINLLSRDQFVKGVPHDWFTWLRNNAPVYHHAEPNGPGFWVITKYDDVVAVGKDAKTFSSDQDRGGVVMIEEPPPGMSNNLEGGGKLMLTTDPPEHTRYRKLVNKGFTPRMINALEKHIREQAVEIIDKAIARGEADFVVDIAADLPLQAIAELIGVPLEERGKLFEWSNRMIGSEDPEYAVTQEEALGASIEMFMYAQALADQRRAEPHDDILSVLLESEVDGERLSEMDFNLFFLLLSVAGNETTRNAISHGMHALLQNPDQYQLLVDDPSRVAVATDEIVRWASPVMYFRRNVTQDTEMRGVEMKAGDKATIYYISGNRDEDIFDDPFTFDVTRDPNPHIGFGGGGPHFCLGTSLAKLEIRVLFEELAQRAPKLTQVGDAPRLRSNFINGLKHLPVKFG